MSFLTEFEQGLNGDENALHKFARYSFNPGKYSFSAIELQEVQRKLFLITPESPLYSQAIMIKGVMYHFGAGCPKDYALAIAHYNEARALGNRTAINNLGCMYRSGRGVGIDYARAKALYEEAVALGSPSAMHNLAWIYWDGHGVDVDHAVARVLWQQASDLGCSFAMRNLAQLCQNPEAGPVDYDKAAWLFFQYFRNEYSDNLGGLPGSYTTVSMQVALILIHLYHNQAKKAQDLYQRNKEKLTALLYQQATRLIDALPSDRELSLNLIDFLLKHDSNPDYLAQRIHIQFKKHTALNEEEEALNLYKKYPQSCSPSGLDWFHLGHAELATMEGLSKANRIARLEQACYFFYQGHKKGDKECYQVLIQFLREKEALEHDMVILYRAVEQDAPENKELINRFLDKRQQCKQQEAVSVLSTFITMKQALLDKRRSAQTFFSKSPIQSQSLDLAHDILSEVQEGAPLAEIVRRPEHLSRIKKGSTFYTLLRPLFHEENNPLNLLLNEADCEQIIQKESSGQLIYEALKADKCMSQEGLKILARHKEAMIAYMKSLPKAQQHEVVSAALNEGSSVHHFFMIQRGFFKPKAGHGSFKVLEQMQRQEMN